MARSSPSFILAVWTSSASYEPRVTSLKTRGGGRGEEGGGEKEGGEEEKEDGGGEEEEEEEETRGGAARWQEVQMHL